MENQIFDLADYQYTSLLIFFADFYGFDLTTQEGEYQTLLKIQISQN